MTAPLDLGALLAQERGRADLSLSELARAAGLTKAHVWEMESGRSNNPTVSTLLGLSRALNINFATICGAARITALGLAPVIEDDGPGMDPKTTPPTQERGEP